MFQKHKIFRFASLQVKDLYEVYTILKHAILVTETRIWNLLQVK